MGNRSLVSRTQVSKTARQSRQLSAVADLHSKILDAPPPPQFFQFPAVFGKIWQKSYVGALLQGLAPPPRGNPGFATGLLSKQTSLCKFTFIRINITFLLNSIFGKLFLQRIQNIDIASSVDTIVFDGWFLKMHITSIAGSSHLHRPFKVYSPKSYHFTGQQSTLVNCQNPFSVNS